MSRASLGSEPTSDAAPTRRPATADRRWRMDYVEIIELPAPMAQAVQILKTAEALGTLGIRVGLHARLLEPTDPGAALRDILGRAPGPRLDVRTLFTRHKGIAGLHHRARLVRRMVGGGDSVLYGRSRRQTVQVCRQRRNLRSKATVVYEFHNIESELAREEGAPEAAERVYRQEREIIALADGIVAISEPLAHDLAELFRLPEPPVIVPDGVDLEPFQTPRADALRGARVNVVYAGSLYPYKGVDGLIEMLLHLPERVHLTIVGGQGPDDLARLKHRAHADARLAGRVHFTGLIAPREVPAHLMAADLVCIPGGTSLRSQRYTSPLKLFEAMAAGTPLVVAPEPSLTTVVRDGVTGWIARGGSPEGMARAVETAIARPDAARAVGSRAREEAAGFSWTSRAERIAHLVEELRTRR